MSASNERLGDSAREKTIKEIIEEEETRLGPFVTAITIEQIEEEIDADVAAEKQRILDQRQEYKGE